MKPVQSAPAASQRSAGVTEVLRLLKEANNDPASSAEDLDRLITELDLECRSQLEESAHLNRKLRRALKDRERETSICAHDLRVPISVITGHIEILDTLTNPSYAQKKSLLAMTRQTERLLAIIDDLLEKKRDQALSLNLNSCDVGPWFESCTRDLRILANKASVSLEIIIKPNLGIRRVDASKLQEAITNLLDNAIKYTPSGGLVLLAVDLADEERLRVRVADSGPGLSENALENAFEYFFRGAVAMDSTDGVGVGLTSVKTFVALHGGEVRARNIASGGAEFTLIIPAFQDELAENELHTDEKRRRILLVDSDKRALYRTASLLSPTFEVLTARSEREALWLIKQLPVDCAIIDLDAPLMTGFTTATELRKDPNRKHLPILFCGELNSSGATTRQSGAELHEILEKPLSSESLNVRVMSAIHDAGQIAAAADSAPKDELTGLVTREYGLGELERQAADSRSQQTFYTVLLIQLDQVPQIAAALGSMVADQLSKELATSLLGSTRTQEIGVRWAADQFLCVHPGTPASAGAIVAERLRDRLSRCCVGSMKSSVSIGVSTFDPSDPISSSELIARADKAMQAAADLGGNHVVSWQSFNDVTLPPPSNKPQRCLLIVDDDEEVLSTLNSYFSQITNLDIRTAESVGDAMRVARQTQPSIAILDLNLPDGTGYELLRKLREFGDPSMPAIAYTGYSNATTIEDTERVGFDACFAKSTKLVKLVREVRRLCGNTGSPFE